MLSVSIYFIVYIQYVTQIIIYFKILLTFIYMLIIWNEVLVIQSDISPYLKSEVTSYIVVSF